MHIYLKNIPGKFHSNPIWNDETLGFLKRSPQQPEEGEQEQKQDE